MYTRTTLASTVSTISKQNHPIFRHWAKSGTAEGCAWDEFIVKRRARLNRTGAAAARRSALAASKRLWKLQSFEFRFTLPKKKTGRFQSEDLNKSADVFFVCENDTHALNWLNTISLLKKPLEFDVSFTTQKPPSNALKKLELPPRHPTMVAATMDPGFCKNGNRYQTRQWLKSWWNKAKCWN